MAFTVIARLKARAGHEAEVAKRLSEITEKTRSEPGTQIFTVYKSLDDPTVFVIYEVYKDKTAFESHFHSPHVQENLARFKDLTESAAHDLLDEVTHR
ncbi:MAG TPA: putative quinol monooxygenase [Candidatus Binataceae bacterium]|jgi:quinol monooxygenase YgiN|nr:putative quinol monooxygenase [Candidatus Binataceae bacterium]